ncbi:hypothetical protein [Leifsonia shinshuensis]
MSRPPLIRTAVWSRVRAGAPLVAVEGPAAGASSATAPVADLAAARRGPERRTRRRARRAA